MNKITSVRKIKDPYSKRILSYLIGRNPLSVFIETPSELRRLIHGLSEKQLRTRPARGKWSIAHLVSHLCDAEWAMGFRLRMVIAQPGRPLQAYDQDKWAQSLFYDKTDCQEKLSLFTSLRRSHVSLLRNLRPREWKRYGIHEERGKETVERMIHMLAGHDINHLRQIKTIRASYLSKTRR